MTFPSGPFTPLAATLYVHGLFLLVGAAFILSRLGRPAGPGAGGPDGGPWTWRGRALAAAFLLAESLLVVRGVSAAWALGPFLAGALLVVLRPEGAEGDEDRAIGFLFAAAAGLALAAEVAAIGGDRMNTLFKLSFQAWVLFAVASGAAVAILWRERRRIPRPIRRAWLAGFALLLALSSLYAVVAVPARLADRFPGIDGKVPSHPPTGLDGLAFTRLGALRGGDGADSGFMTLAEDAAAIDWMNRNVRGTPVIVEAQTVEYRWGSRYSIYTGLPTVAGWSWHTRQHRAAVPGDVVTRRAEAVAAFYATPDEGEATAFLRRYGVRYIVAGPLEAWLSPPEGLAKLDRMAGKGVLSVAYRAGGVTLYEVRPLS